MNHKLLFGATIACCALAAGTQTSKNDNDKDKAGPRAEASARLPGARPVIDAAAYPTLQAAIDALPATGGVVRIPPGEFEIDQPLKITHGDTLLEGSGSATHLKNTNTEGQPAIVIKADKKGEKLWRVKLANFRLTGNPKSGHGVLAHQVNEVFLDGVTLSYHGGHGILLEDCYEDPRICDSLITYNKQAGLAILKCHDIIVSANHFEENQDAVTCRDSFNLCMSGNNLDDHLRHGVVIERTYGSIVSSNMIEECQGSAVVLDRDCYGITVSANVIAHNTNGVDLRDAHGCAVSANTFTLNLAHGLIVGPGSGRITVSANNFSDSYIGGGDFRKPEQRIAGGILLDGASDITIVGNSFSGLDTPAVDQTDKPSLRILIKENSFVDVIGQNQPEDSRQ